MGSALTLSAILVYRVVSCSAKFMVFQKFQDSPFTGDFPFVQTKRAYWNSSLINIDVSECKGRESY